MTRCLLTSREPHVLLAACVLSWSTIVSGCSHTPSSAQRSGDAQTPAKRAANAVTQTPEGARPETKGPAPAKPAPAKSPARATLPKQGLTTIGVGVGAPLDYEDDLTFADAIKVARAIEPEDGVASDPNGWLRGDGAIFVWASSKDNGSEGTYRLRYDGKARVTAELSEALVGEPKYDAATNTSTREIKLAKPQETFKLRFSHTTAGVRNVKLMRPIHRGASEAHRFDETWYRPMKALHERFAWIRTMDFTATNGQNVVRWSDRTLPARWSQQNPVEGSWWQGRGAAWEYAVHLANEAHKDLWICVPLLADDAYVKNLALLLRYGSDGVNPYSGPEAKPVWAPLDPQLNLYVEYSNEVWNFGFPQWLQLLEQTKAEVARGHSNLNYDGATFDGEWNTRHWARRIVEVSQIFRKVFGDDAMMTRIRPLFETQAAWADNYFYKGLMFIDAWYGNGDGQQHVETPHPVNYFIWGAGGSTYPVGFSEKLDQSKTLTVAQIFAEFRTMLPAWSEIQTRDIDFSRAFGLVRISYEGGTGLDNRGEEYAKANAEKDAAQRDPRIEQVYQSLLQRYGELGGDGFTNFLTVNRTHGVLPAYEGTNLESPKTRAIDHARAMARPKLTWGVPLPATLWANRFRVSSSEGSGEHDEPKDFDEKTWASYTVRNDEPGRYAVRVSARNRERNARLNVWIDGELAGTLTLPASDDESTYLDSPSLGVTLAPGQHGIRLDGLSGSFTVKQLKIEAASP